MGGKECVASLGPGQGCLPAATGWLFSTCGRLPGSLSDSREAAGQPGAEEEGRGSGPAWGSSLGCPTCQILWDARGGACLDRHVCFPEHSKVPWLRTGVPSEEETKGREVHVFGLRSIR